MLSTDRGMYQAPRTYQETKQERMLALVELLFKWGEIADQRVAGGFENRPEACVVQMVTVSAFANITEPNQRLLNKNSFAIISISSLMATYTFYLSITHSVPSIGLSNEHITLKEITEVHCSQCF